MSSIETSGIMLQWSRGETEYISSADVINLKQLSTIKTHSFLRHKGKMVYLKYNVLAQINSDGEKRFLTLEYKECNNSGITDDEEINNRGIEFFWGTISELEIDNEGGKCTWRTYENSEEEPVEIPWAKFFDFGKLK